MTTTTREPKRSAVGRGTVRTYLKHFLSGRTHTRQYRWATNVIVELLMSYRPRLRIDELDNQLLKGFSDYLRLEHNYSGSGIRSAVGRSRVIWAFAYEQGHSHNPPPERPGRGRAIHLPSEGAQVSPQSGPLPQLEQRDGRATVKINGVTHDLGIWDDKAKINYERRMCEFEASGRATHFGIPTASLTVGELVTHFLHYMKSNTPVVKGRQSEGAAIRFGLRYLSMYLDIQAADFGPAQLEAVRMRMAMAGLCRKTCNQHCQRIVRMFRWAVAQSLAPPNSAHALAAVRGWRKGRCPVREPPSIMPVDTAQLDATLPHLHPVVRAMVELQRLTAMRPAETCIVRPGDIDRSGEIWRYRPAHHKTEHHGVERCIFIGPKAQTVLMPFLLRPAESYCFCPKQVSRDAYERQKANRPARRTKRYPSEIARVERKKAAMREKWNKITPGECYTTGAYRVAIHRVCLSHGIAAWSPNQLRHLAATEIRRQFGLEAAQVMLGHTRADTTQIYAERNGDLAVKVAKEVG